MVDIQVYDKPSKGKRKCPALKGYITAKDCGQHRLKEIRCLGDCKYLEHERYQHVHVAEQFHQTWTQEIIPFYQNRDAFALDFLVLLEFASYKFVKANPLTNDSELIEALNFLHRQLSPIQVVESVGTSFGNNLVEEIQTIQKQNPQFDADKAQQIIDLLLKIINIFKDKTDHRKAINGLMGHLEKNFDLASLNNQPVEEQIETPPKIITPE